VELDFSGYTQATPENDSTGTYQDSSNSYTRDSEVDQANRDFANFQDFSRASPKDTGIFGGGGDSVDFSDFSSAGFAGGAPRSNITNSSSYDPTFAALGQLSRGLDPRDLKGYQDTSFAKQNVDGIMSLRPNSLQQLNQPQVDRITEALKLSGNTDAYKQVSSLRGDDLKNYAAGMDLKNLNLSDFDKMDTQSLANIFSTLGMSEKNPYGISAQGTQTGITGVISNLLGADTNPDFRGSMSSKDIAEKARAGLGFATGSGQLNPNANPRNPMEFGSVSGIANQFGRDASAGATQIKDALLGLANNVMSYGNKDGKAQAGKTIDDIISDDRENEPISDSTDNITNPYFNPITSPTIKKEDVLNKTFMDADNTSVNQNFPDPRQIPDLLRDQIKYAGYGKPSGEGIVSLPEASGLDNNVISAGESRGKELSDFTPFPIPDVDRSRGKELSDFTPFPIPDVDRSGDIGDNLLAKGIREPGDDYVKYKDGSIDFFPSYIPGLETNNFKRSKADELYDKNEADRQRTARETRAALNKSIDIRGKPFENILEQKAADLEKRMIAFYNKNAPISDNTPEAKIGNAFAEEERVLRNLMDQQRKSGENLPFTAQNVNLVPNRITGEGFVLENKAGMGQDITREDINELMNLGYNETEAIEILNQQQYSEKIGLRFEDLPPDLKQQYFLNTNLDYGRSDQKPFNVVY